MELTFKKMELEDREMANEYIRSAAGRSCETSFANIYLWQRHYRVEYTIIEDAIVFKTMQQEPSFSYPYSKGDTKKVLDIMMEYAKEQGFPFRMYSVTKEDFEELERLYPGKFEIEYDRDSADYIYETEKLITLSGKKYHGKRNHINRFKELYPDWSYESITKDNVEECFQMALKWRNINGCEEDSEKLDEICVTLNALRLLEELQLKGGLIRVNGDIVAFAIGEEICEDTFCVHIEKAFADIQGAYPMINQQFAEKEGVGYHYINREEDLGSEGLRKAKLSYRPVFLQEKGIVKEING